MPSITNNSSSTMAVDGTNKSNTINAMLLRAWRERWDDAQWGTHIKTILPNDLSGDLYDLADSILQQAVVGSDVNKLVLSYLRHSLCSRQITHVAVIKRISKFDGFDRPYCLIALLDFMDSIMAGVTCRSIREESSLPSAFHELLHWLIQAFSFILEAQFTTEFISSQHQHILGILKRLLENILSNQFIVANIFIAKQEDPDTHKKLDEKMQIIRSNVSNKKCASLSNAKEIEVLLSRLLAVKLNGKILERNDALLDEQAESITYCVQPFIAVNVLLNPNCSTHTYELHLQTIQQIKNYSPARIYSELIRAALISLHNVSNGGDTSRESLWCAFTFIRVPQIIKQLSLKNDKKQQQQQQSDHSPDVVKALEMLIDDPTLDLLDTTCACNTIQYLLDELAKHNLLNAQQVQQFSAQRDPVMVQLSKIDLNNHLQHQQQQQQQQQQPSTSIIWNLKKAESPWAGILKALDSNDFNKMQETDMLQTLCALLSGNNFELILSLATMEGKLKTFTERLIQWNENAWQAVIDGGDKSPATINRSAYFDVTFLMLVFIVQTYGSHVVLDQRGNTFFEKWVRDFMIEKNRNKSAMNMVHQCEQGKVDEFLTSISSSSTSTSTSGSSSSGGGGAGTGNTSGDSSGTGGSGGTSTSASLTTSSSSSGKTSNLRWHETCLILPGVLYQLLVAWENETISAAEVKIHLDNIKNRLCAYSVCAASWLCSYMQIIRDDELLKPLNMVQQFCTVTATADELKITNNFKERFHLTSQIIRKMQTDAHQNQKARSPILDIVSNQPLEEQFHEVWRSVTNRGWLSIKASQVLDNLLQSCGPYWLVSKMVNEVLYCKFSKDISKLMDIVFAVMHLNIQKCTVTLLSELLPMMLLNKTQKFELIEPQLSVLARFCVYCIISSLAKIDEDKEDEQNQTKKLKRSFNENETSKDDERPSKKPKVDDSLLEILSDGTEKMETTSNRDGDVNVQSSSSASTKSPTKSPSSKSSSKKQSTAEIPEPLNGCLQNLFKTLYKLTFSSDLTPKVLFVRQFLIYLHRCGGESILPVLNIFPSDLMKNLLKIPNDSTFNYDFVLRMYDLTNETGRKNALTNISLLQSIQHSNTIKF